MAKSIKSIDEFKTPDAYLLENCEYIKEVDSFALTLRHKRSTARVLALSSDDDNKVFCIGFRTPPKDDAGEAHIIEHSVLCGSRSFPVKDPFVELVKGSLNTFLNAMTYPDKTLYPVASCNDADFKNLMHVYMDAVFYPSICEHEEIFKQEGWHYEIEDEDSPLTYNGVVYNEMKGVFSSEAEALERYIMNGLFPDGPYGRESGGDPKHIPELTYEKYLDFYRTYYHPSNSYIYLYGDMDIEERLIWMDENYLKDFSAIDPGSQIVGQRPFDEMRIYSKTYAIDKDEDRENKTCYAYAAAADAMMDQKKSKAFDLLSYVLVEMPGAPIKQALLDAGIGADIDGGFSGGLLQGYFSVTARKAPAGRRDEFYEIIHKTLEKTAREGIDRKALKAAINGMEFREREADYGSFPKGLFFCLQAMNTWLYDDADPYSALRYDKAYKFLRDKLSTDYYEELVREYFLDNAHAALIEMKPEPGLAEKNELEIEKKLDAYKKSLSKEEIRKLVDDARALRAYQEEESSKEDLEKIPTLGRGDIGKNALPYCNEEIDLSGVKAIHHDLATSGIIYLSFYFDISELKEYMPQISFLSTLLGYMDTEKYGYKEFDVETNLYTGGISCDVDIFPRYGKKDEYEIKFELRVKAMADRVGRALELLSQMALNTSFEDEKHLKEVVAETRAAHRMRIFTAGNRAAAARVNACSCESSWLSDRCTGIGYYDYLVRLDEHFDEEKDGLTKGCVELVKAIFKKEKLVVSCTGSREELNALREEMPSFLEELDAFESKDGANGADLGGLDRFVPNVGHKREAFTTPSEVDCVALGGLFEDPDAVDYGALKVVQHLLNYDYLWNAVRVKGGAYGVGCSFTRDGEWCFSSYSDPNLGATLETYRNAADYLKNYDASEREMTKAVIGTISGMDAPLTPSMKGNRSMTAYFMDIGYDVLQKERESVLECGVDDIRKAADAVGGAADKNNICVIGSSKLIGDEADAFDKVEALA